MNPATILDQQPRDVIEVRGDEAITYLQGQLSQDVGALAAHQPVWSLLLQPTGKMGAWIRVTRLDGPNDLRIDVDAGAGAEVLARLERFKLRSQVEFTLLPGAGQAASADQDPAAAEARRIEAGVPKMGAEIVDDVIPAELGQWFIDQTVSFTKGCFTGQELVARIDSRGGNVPRHLRGLVLGGDVVPEPGAAVSVGDDVVGTVTSAGRSPELGAPVALAFIARRIEVPATARVAGVEGPAEIRALPLVAMTPA